MFKWLTGRRKTASDGVDVFEHLASGKSMESLVSEINRESTEHRKELAKLARKPGIAQVLTAHNCSENDYYEAFHSLQGSALEGRSWEIVSHPQHLNALLTMRRDKKSNPQIWGYFQDK